MTLHPWRRAKALGVLDEPSGIAPAWHCFCGVELRAPDFDSADGACGCPVLTGGLRHLEGMQAYFISGVWRPETSADPHGWCRHRPSHGQGVVTALEVQRLCGGVLLQTVNDGVTHLWNQLSDGTEVDLTRDQFDEWWPCGPTVVRERADVLADERIAARYELVLVAVTRPRAA